MYETLVASCTVISASSRSVWCVSSYLFETMVDWIWFVSWSGTSGLVGVCGLTSDEVESVELRYKRLAMVVHIVKIHG